MCAEPDQHTSVPPLTAESPGEAPAESASLLF